MSVGLAHFEERVLNELELTRHSAGYAYASQTTVRHAQYVHEMIPRGSIHSYIIPRQNLNGQVNFRRGEARAPVLGIRQDSLE